MGINGISSGYYKARYTYENKLSYGKKKADTVEAGFAGSMNKTAAAQNASFVLHISNETDGEAIGSSTDGSSSVTVYKPKDFDPSHPVYKVKAWDAEGNVTAERMVDVTQVDPNSADYLDMFAYSSYLTASGKCPAAQSAFMYASVNPHGAGNVYGSYTDSLDWISVLQHDMQQQYELGNLSFYAKYKQFWDFLMC